MNASLHIDRLRFRGSEAHRRRLMTDVDQMSWPAVGERDYLFIRQIAVRDVPRRLAYRLADAVAESHAGAVSGFDAQAEQADAVYFATLADLLAALTLDLLAGRYRWYWRSWRFLFDASRDDAVIELWRQYLQQLPAIADQWSRDGVALVLWPKLSQRVTLTLARLLFPTVDTAAMASRSPANRVDWPARWLLPWQPLFRRNDVSSSSKSLAALLIIKHFQPLCFMRADVENTLTGLMSVLMTTVTGTVDSDAVESATISGRDIIQGTALAGTVRQHSHDALQPLADATTSCGKGEGDKIERCESGALFTSADPVRLVVTAGAESIQKSEQTLSIGAQPSATDQRITAAEQGHYDGVHTIDEQAWSTSTGGLFYLLNVLNLPGVQARLRADEQAMRYPSAWGWLYRLAQALNWASDAAVLTFLASECGLSTPERLDELPVFPALYDIVDIALQRYGDLLSLPCVGEVPARVTMDNVYLDLFFAMSSVRLDVRRVGLDIDPGWLVWLGRVVKFHYGDEGFQS